MRTSDPFLGGRFFCLRKCPTAATTSSRVNVRYAMTTYVTPRWASLMVFSTLGISMGGFGDGVGASHRQLITGACPPFNAAASAHRLRIPLPACGLSALAAAPSVTQGGTCPAFGLHQLPGLFSVLVHGAHFLRLPVSESIRIRRSTSYAV